MLWPMLSKTYSIFHIDLMITDHSGPNSGPKILKKGALLNMKRYSLMNISQELHRRIVRRRDTCHIGFIMAFISKRNDGEHEKHAHPISLILIAFLFTGSFPGHRRRRRNLHRRWCSWFLWKKPSMAGKEEKAEKVLEMDGMPEIDSGSDSS